MAFKPRVLVVEDPSFSGTKGPIYQAIKRFVRNDLGGTCYSCNKTAHMDSTKNIIVASIMHYVVTEEWKHGEVIIVAGGDSTLAAMLVSQTLPIRGIINAESEMDDDQLTALKHELKDLSS